MTNTLFPNFGKAKYFYGGADLTAFADLPARQPDDANSPALSTVMAGLPSYRAPSTPRGAARIWLSLTSKNSTGSDLPAAIQIQGAGYIQA